MTELRAGRTSRPPRDRGRPSRRGAPTKRRAPRALIMRMDAPRGLRVAERHPEDLPPALAADTRRHDKGLRDDSAAVADVEVGGVEEQVREPGVIDPAVQELLHRFVDLGADPGHRGPRDTGVVAQRSDELVDLAGAHPVDPRLADHRVEGLVHPPPRVQQRREERPLPQLRELKVDLTGRSRERLRPSPVAAGRAFRGAFVTAGADLRRRSGPAGRPAGPAGTRPDAQARERRGLRRSRSSRQTGGGSSWDSLLCFLPETMVIPRCPPPTSTTTRTVREVTPRYGTHPYRALAFGQFIPPSQSSILFANMAAAFLESRHGQVTPHSWRTTATTSPASPHGSAPCASRRSGLRRSCDISLISWR